MIPKPESNPRAAVSGGGADRVPCAPQRCSSRRSKHRQGSVTGGARSEEARVLSLGTPFPTREAVPSQGQHTPGRPKKGEVVF